MSDWVMPPPFESAGAGDEPSPPIDAPVKKRRRRRGNLRRTLALYREAATPDVIHRAVKTAWTGVTGGTAAGLGASLTLPLPGGVFSKILLAVIAALGSGFTSFLSNLFAEVDRLLAAQAAEDQ